MKINRKTRGEPKYCSRDHLKKKMRSTADIKKRVAASGTAWAIKEVRT